MFGHALTALEIGDEVIWPRFLVSDPVNLETEPGNVPSKLAFFLMKG